MYYTYSDYLKNKYHEKVYKLSCQSFLLPAPNRLKRSMMAAISVRNKGTGFEALNHQLSVTEQLTLTREKIEKNIMHINLLLIFKTIRIHFCPLTDLKNICGKVQAFRML